MNKRQRSIVDNIEAADSVSKHLATLWGLQDEREDIIAEGRLWLVEAVDTFDPSAGMCLRSWCRNVVSWRLRGQWMRKRHLKCRKIIEPARYHEREVTTYHDQEPGPYECTAMAEMCSALGDAMWGNVSPSQRRVVVGRYIHGDSPEEIAQRMDIARGTYDTHRNRALRRLRALASLREHW